MSINFIFNPSDPFENYNEKISKALDYLNSLNSKQILEDQQAYQAFYFIGKTSNFIQSDLFLEKKTYLLLAQVLLELSHIILELDFAHFKLDFTDQFKKLNKNDIKIAIFESVLYILNIILIRSVIFTRQFSTNQGLEALIKILNNEKFINSISNNLMLDYVGNEIYIIDYMVLNVYILSKSCDENLQSWFDLDAINVLLKMARLRLTCQLDAYLSIANVVDDKQIENLTEIHKIVDQIQIKIKHIANDFKNNNYLRFHRQIVENEKIIDVEVHCIKEENNSLSSLLVFFSGLYRLSVNDKLKYDIYFNNRLFDDLKEILFKSNEIEKIYSLRLYAQLSFNKQICLDMKTNKDLVNYIEKLSNDKQSLDIENLCKRILWNLQQNKVESLDQEQTKIKGEHIMISYNSFSRDLCVKIKAQLEALGHKVWIDISDIHGSSLDSMAKAIEDSICVLICITEKYRQSINCQAEAQYAFKLNKPIIPLIMQKGYENVKGWLGIILSDKIFINYTKYEFEDCSKRLKFEIDFILNKKIDNFPRSIQTVSKNESAENWNEDKVKEWFEKNNIDKPIAQQFLPSNGIVLRQLYEMRRDAPEFFYQSLNKDNNLNLKSIILFTHCLNKLFKS